MVVGRMRTPENDRVRVSLERKVVRWTQVAASLAHVVAGAFLLYLYIFEIRNRILLGTGILFLAFGAYRASLAHRSTGRR